LEDLSRCKSVKKLILFWQSLKVLYWPVFLASFIIKKITKQFYQK